MRFRFNILPTLVAAVFAVVGLAACGSSSSSSTAAAKSTTPTTSATKSTTPTTASKVDNAKTVDIKIANYKYYPAAVTVKVGTKIVVTNTDQTAHTLTARSGAFDSGTIQPGKTMSFTVTKTGVFPYYCQFHAFMAGTLTVAS